MHDDVLENDVFFVEMSTLKAIKSYFARSYDKQNITLVFISYDHLCNILSIYKNVNVRSFEALKTLKDKVWVILHNSEY